MLHPIILHLIISNEGSYLAIIFEIVLEDILHICWIRCTNITMEKANDHSVSFVFFCKISHVMVQSVVVDEQIKYNPPNGVIVFTMFFIANIEDNNKKR